MDVIENDKYKCILINNEEDKIYWLTKNELDTLKNKVKLDYVYENITSKYTKFNFNCDDDI